MCALGWSAKDILFIIIFNFLFCTGLKPINIVVIVSVNSEGTQPHIIMYPFSPKLPSYPGCT